MSGLVGDIGGTNVRLGLSLKSGERPVYVKSMQVADFTDVGAAIRSYMSDLPAELNAARIIDKGVIAVAGPVYKNRIKFTNNHWAFSGDAVAKDLGFKSLKLYNDYTAKALSLPDLTQDDYVDIPSSDPLPRPDNTIKVVSVLGPGTGLGVSALIEPEEGKRWPLATEGGHTGYAPETDEEIEVKLWLREKYKRVSVERLLCGEGLQNIYQALCSIRGIPAEKLSPADISYRALEGKDILTVASLQLFCGMLGSVAGDVALTHGANEGVFIAGGIVPKILPFFQQSSFRTRFENKGRFEPAMKRLFTRVITHTCPAHLGCAYRLWNPES